MLVCQVRFNKQYFEYKSVIKACILMPIAANVPVYICITNRFVRAGYRCNYLSENKLNEKSASENSFDCFVK